VEVAVHKQYKGENRGDVEMRRGSLIQHDGRVGGCDQSTEAWCQWLEYSTSQLRADIGNSD
jgi:hypothetical protein